MTEAQFKEIGKLTERYSGSDINGLIKNACYEPLRKFQSAKYFKQVGTGPSGKAIWMPCGPSESGATKIDKTKLTSEEIKKNTICMDDFLKAIHGTKPTVGLEDLENYVKWTKEYGMDG